ncbi:MAG: bifunctional riboflavin kinase/FAD synthetase [Bacteroidetes bacterium]|nr:bifunctional riboflavin kinase/FAD synthetase [Bacteroidota bacterium]
MKVYRDLDNLPDFKNAVVSIGSFDGVHCGHQKIIEKVKNLAEEIGGESIILSFHPHPRLIVYPKDQSLQLLTTVEEKIFLFEKYGIDHLVLVPFTIEFSQQSPDEYIQKFLVEKFHPRYVVVGYDHRFGLNRRGDINYLKWHGNGEGFEVIEIKKQEVEKITVSSTKLRAALKSGDLKTAYQWMDHHFLLSGKIIHGQKLGEKLGYPTANIEIENSHKLLPPNGIYAVYVTIRQKRYRGMLYIGNRPTLNEHSERRIEVNIFNFSQNIYEEQILIELIDFVRSDEKFASLEELKNKLAEDENQSLSILKRHEASPATIVPKKPSVAIVILNYNGKKYLEMFLSSVMDTNYPNFSIYVADNGSSDDSIAFLEEQHLAIKIIDLKTNFGFAEGYNQALKQIDSEYFLLLNSDVEVEPDWLEKMMAQMEEDRTIGACQPKLCSHPQKEFFEYAGASGGWMDYLGYPFCRGRLFQTVEKDERQYDNPIQISWATGAAFLIRARLFHKLGGFDGDFFAHLEEIDLCWRLRRAGYKIIVVPEARAFHIGGGTLSYDTPKKNYLNFRNSLITITKNETVRKLIWLLPVKLILDGVAGLYFLYQNKTGHFLAILKAHWNYYASFRSTLRKRKRGNHLVKRYRIGASNNHGIYKSSVVWHYFVKRKTTFDSLPGMTPKPFKSNKDSNKLQP